MYKFSFIVLLMLLLAGCDNGQTTRTVEEFKADKEQRHSMLATCKNNAGEKSLSPNCIGNPPAFSVRQKWSYAAIANFIAGVIPPSAMLGRSWLYVHSQR
ncbi:hypothetical protein RM61_23455, partial [Xanthomonas phaseoli pv. phaseoli]